MAIGFVFARGSRIVRIFAAAGGALTALRSSSAWRTSLWLLPTVLREAHAANAIATFIAFVCAATAAAYDPARAALARRRRRFRRGGARTDAARGAERMNSTLSRVDGVLPLRLEGWRGMLIDYYELTKPRIICCCWSRRPPRW